MPLLAALVIAACGGDNGDNAAERDSTSTPRPGRTRTSTPERPRATSTAELDDSPTAERGGSAQTPSSDGFTSADGDRVLKHIERLSVSIGPRTAGTDGAIAGRDYVATTLRSYGYDVSFQEFEFDATQFLPARIDAGETAIAALAMPGSASGTASGPLVFVELGYPEDYPPEGLAGGIALIERGELTFADKVDNAIAAGAVGVVIYNNVEGGFLGSLAGAVNIPVATVDQETGLDLVDSLEVGPFDVTIRISEQSGIAHNVVAKPPGVSTCATVTGGHHDSVPITGGADDNASGTAATIELARIAAANGLPGANCFVLFGAEEFGLLGSAYFVEQLTDAEINGLRAMINLDVVGLPEPLTLIGSDDLVEVARLEAEALGVEATPGFVPGGSSSDHASFLDAGIPAVFFYRHDELIHTPSDAIDRMSADSLAETVDIAYATLVALGD